MDKESKRRQIMANELPQEGQRISLHWGEKGQREKSAWDATGLWVPLQTTLAELPAFANLSNPTPNPPLPNASLNPLCPRPARTMAACVSGPGGASCSASTASGLGCREHMPLLLSLPLLLTVRGALIKWVL